jgi:hypothetical protein
MDRVAVFVDAGYLFAQGSLLMSGAKQPRGSVAIEHEKAIRALAEFALRVAGVPLLRVYWYDGTSTGPTPQHLTLAHLHEVKIRLGFVNSVGEQKGVDSLIVTDMIELARNRAMSDAVLLSGDEDLRVGVQQAQEFGVRVHLLGLKPSRGTQSLFLLQEADTTHEWSAADIAPFLAVRTDGVAKPVAASAPNAADSRTALLLAIATQVADEIPASEIAALISAIRDQGQIPRAIDGRLLARCGARLEAGLDSSDKRLARKLLVEACEARLKSSPSEADA